MELVGDAARRATPTAPRYVAIADTLAARWSGITPNSLVDSETQIAASFEINRQTAREVLKELERRNLVRRIVGRGTFTALKLAYPIERGRPPSFRRVVAEAGYVHEILHASVRWQRKTSTRPRMLVSERLVAVEGRVAAFATDTFVEPIGMQVVDAVRSGASIFDTLQELGLSPWRRRVAVSAGQPGRPVAARLGYATAPPSTWNVRSQTVNAATGAELHHSDTWLRSDVFDVGITLDFPPDELTTVHS
ncbi:MAG: DNA-binding GntR family transcriptional regulator [Ilumatobacter sp.]